MRFLSPDGQRINGDQTPEDVRGEGSRRWAQHSPAVLTSRLPLLPSAQLDMEDGDSIDAMILQARRDGRERAWHTA